MKKQPAQKTATPDCSRHERGDIRQAHGKLGLTSMHAPVAQRIEHPPPKRGAAGSIPAGRATFRDLFATRLQRMLGRGADDGPFRLAGG